MLQELFQDLDIGRITDMKLIKNDLIFKSTGFIRFANPKDAKIACSKKDRIIVEKSQIRVFVCWTPDENLSTIRVRNFPENSTRDDLVYLFNTHGDIVDVRIVGPMEANPGSEGDDHKSEYQTHALISYVRIEHAKSAAQEMDGSVIGCEGALSVELVNSDARNLQWIRQRFEYITIQIPEVSDEPFAMQKQHKKHRNRNHRHSDHKNNGHLRLPHHDRRHQYQGPRHNEHDSGHQRRRNRRGDGYKTRRPIRDKASQSTLLGPLYIGSNRQYTSYSVTPSPRPHGNVSDSSSNDSHNLHQTALQRNTSTDSIASNHSVQSLPSTFVPPGPSTHDNKRTAMDHYGMPSKYGNQRLHSPQPYYPLQSAPQRSPVSPSTSIISTGSTTHSVPTPTGFIASNQMTRSLTPTGLCIPSLTPTSTTPVSTGNTYHFPTNHANPMFAPNATGNLPPITGGLSQGMNQITTGLSQATLDTINRFSGVNGVQPMPMLSQLSPPALTPPIHLTPTTNQIIMQQISVVDGSTQSVQCTGNNAPILYSPLTLQGPLIMTPVQPQNFKVPNQGKTDKVSSAKKRQKPPQWKPEQQQIGNELFALIEQKYPVRARKIVGMFLQGFPSCDELRHLMQKDTCILSIAAQYNQQIRDKEASESAK